MVRGADPAPGRLGPVAEAVAVLAGAVAQVQPHGGPPVVDAQRSKGARPHLHRLLKGEVRVHLTFNVTCESSTGSPQFHAPSEPGFHMKLL